MIVWICVFVYEGIDCDTIFTVSKLLLELYIVEAHVLLSSQRVRQSGTKLTRRLSSETFNDLTPTCSPNTPPRRKPRTFQVTWKAQVRKGPRGEGISTLLTCAGENISLRKKWQRMRHRAMGFHSFSHVSTRSTSLALSQWSHRSDVTVLLPSSDDCFFWGGGGVLLWYSGGQFDAWVCDCTVWVQGVSRIVYAR